MADKAGEKSSRELRGIEAMQRKLEEAEAAGERKVPMRTMVSVNKLKEVIAYCKIIGCDSESQFMNMGIQKMLSR